MPFMLCSLINQLKILQTMGTEKCDEEIQMVSMAKLIDW